MAAPLPALAVPSTAREVARYRFNGDVPVLDLRCGDHAVVQLGAQLWAVHGGRGFALGPFSAPVAYARIASDLNNLLRRGELPEASA